MNRRVTKIQFRKSTWAEILAQSAVLAQGLFGRILVSRMCCLGRTENQLRFISVRMNPGVFVSCNEYPIVSRCLL